MGEVIVDPARGGGADAERSAERPSGRSATLVWIDSRDAILIRWRDRAARAVRIRSAVPPHHRSTGHVRHDPGFRHGGGGAPQTAGEPRRIEHLERFLDAVMARLPDEDDLLLLGPGAVHEQLERHVRERDAVHGVHREIACEPAAAATRAQLVARLRHAVGDEPRRRTARGHGWERGHAGTTGRGGVRCAS
jgi:hypothetical protein